MYTIPVITACVRLDYSNYDLWPASLTFIDPRTRQPANPAVRAPAAGPAGVRDALVDGHPDTGRPFLCLPGIREYHNHPQHSGDDWLLHRATGAGRLAVICERIWQRMARNVVGLSVTVQALPPAIGTQVSMALSQGDLSAVLIPGLARTDESLGISEESTSPRPLTWVTIRPTRSQQEPDMASPLALVTTFRIPRGLLDQTLDVLRDAGRHGHEAFVVWGGTVGDNQSVVTFATAIAPAQTAHKTDNGLLVTVDGKALFDINRALFRRSEILAGQVHSHPADAYHSDTDDHYPLVTLAGALSLVVPDFAEHAPDDIARWAWYRLIGTGAWAYLTSTDRIEFIY